MNVTVNSKIKHQYPQIVFTDDDHKKTVVKLLNIFIFFLFYTFIYLFLLISGSRSGFSFCSFAVLVKKPSPPGLLTHHTLG